MRTLKQILLERQPDSTQIKLPSDIQRKSNYISANLIAAKATSNEPLQKLWTSKGHQLDGQYGGSTGWTDGGNLEDPSPSTLRAIKDNPQVVGKYPVLNQIMNGDFKNDGSHGQNNFKSSLGAPGYAPAFKQAVDYAFANQQLFPQYKTGEWQRLRDISKELFNKIMSGSGSEINKFVDLFIKNHQAMSSLPSDIQAGLKKLKIITTY